MTNQTEDIQDINFVFNSIIREDWVDEEVLLTYEDCYRRLKKLAVELNLDTTNIDLARKIFTEISGQI